MNNEKHLEPGEASTSSGKGMTLQSRLVINQGLSILEFGLRFFAVFGTIGSALAMGTSEESVASLTQFVLLRARYDDLPTLTFFVIANSVAGAYLVLSLPVSIYHFVRTKAKTTRISLIVFDTAMLALVSAGASAATATVYLAHEGNGSANWPAICQQFGAFCERISGSLIGSFAALILLMLIIVTSAIALSRCP